MTMFYLPSAVVFMPLLGAVFLLFIRGTDRVVSKNSRHVALLISLCVWGLSFATVFIPEAHKSLIAPGGKFIGLDALSMLFVLLISLLTVLAISVIRRHVSFCVREFTFLTMLAQTFMLAAVCSQNVLRFFVFWEAAVLPLFLMVAVWGAEKRIFTAYKFFFSDLVGAAVLMPAMFLLADKTELSAFEQTEVLVCFVVALALKAPLFPFHAWLSDTQAEAPVPTGILLCGIFTKLPFFAFLKWALPVTGTVMVKGVPFLLIWAVFSAFYGALITLKQTEIKKIAGFAHLAQVGFLAAGLFCLEKVSLQATVFLCVAQGLAVTAYLMAAGALSARFKAAAVKEPTGVMRLFPYLGAAFFVSCLAVLAVPPLMPFTGQFVIFGKVFAHSRVAAFFLVLSVVLLYVSFFGLFTRLLFGEPPERALTLTDMSWREKTATVAFGLIFLFLSVMPESVFNLAGLAVGG